MGQDSSSPVTSKASENDALPSKGFMWAASSMQGWRVQMEDAHFAIGAMEAQGWEDTAAFGVMDGHGGKEVAEFCGHYLPIALSKGSPSRDLAPAMVEAFHSMDDLLRDGEQGLDGGPGFNHFSGKHTAANPQWVGCTAVVCLVRQDVIVVANCGDSRAVLSRRRQAVPLSEDHKPNNPREKERIQRAGGCVERQQVGPNVQYRVNGNLNLSRCIGDLEYKKNQILSPSEQMICATPDVQSFKREAGDEFMLVACDGVWDVLSNQDAVDFVHARLPAYLSQGRRLSGILDEMLDSCISPDLVLTQGLGGDNMTVVLLVFGNHASRGPSPRAAPRTGGLQGAWGDGSEKPDHAPNLDEGVIAPKGLCWCQSNTALK